MVDDSICVFYTAHLPFSYMFRPSSLSEVSQPAHEFPDPGAPHAPLMPAILVTHQVVASYHNHGQTRRRANPPLKYHLRRIHCMMSC